MTLPTDPKARKAVPIATGVIDYFPDALAAVAECSKKGNDQHNPGKPLHWDRNKSQDEADALMRHFIERGHMDSDGIRHSAKVAWRALALLQKEIEAEWESTPAPKADGDGWIPHDGGECPILRTDMPYQIKFRNGEEHGPYSPKSPPPYGWLWRHHGVSGDVVAWRYVRP